MSDLPQIDLSEIEWVLNGERANETNLNRPLKQFLAKINAINTQIDDGFDSLEEMLGSFSSAVVLKGSWDPMSGIFPSNAKIGWSWIASASGVVDGVDFVVNDRLLCINETTGTTYEGNWLKLDYSDHVTSVNGLTGAVKITADNVTGLGSLSKLNYGSSPVEFRDNSENDGRYVQKEGSKKLTDENFTTALKNRLETIQDQVPSDWFAVAGPSQVLNKPLNLSDFSNDLGFITEEQASSSDWNATAGPTQIFNKPTNLSQFENDLLPSNWLATTGPDRIVNKPTDLNQFNNASGYVKKDELQQSDWNSISGITRILNKPYLGTVVSFNYGEGDYEIRNNSDNDKRYASIASNMLKDSNLDDIIEPGIYSQYLESLTPGKNYPVESAGVLRVYSLDGINVLNKKTYTVRDNDKVTIRIDDNEDIQFLDFNFLQDIPDFKLIRSSEFGHFEDSATQIQMESLGLTAQLANGMQWILAISNVDSLTTNFKLTIQAFGALGNIGWEDVEVKVLEDFVLGISSGLSINIDVFNNKIVNLESAVLEVLGYSIVLTKDFDFGYFKDDVDRELYNDLGLYVSYDTFNDAWSCSFNDTTLGDSIYSNVTDSTIFKFTLKDESNISYGPKEVTLLDIPTEVVDVVPSEIQHNYYTKDSLYLRLYNNRTKIWSSWSKIGAEDFVQRIVPVSDNTEAIKKAHLSSIQVRSLDTSVEQGLPVGWNCKIVAKGSDITVDLGSEVALETQATTFLVYGNGSVELIKISETEWLVYSNRLVLETEAN